MKYSYKVGGRDVVLESDDDVLAVRFEEPALHSVRARVASASGLGAFAQRIEVPEEPYTIIPVAPAAAPRAERCARAVAALESSDDVARVAHVFKCGETRVFAPDRVLVGLRPGTNGSALFAKHGGAVVSENDGEFVLRFDPSTDPLAVAKALSAEKGVSYAEPDFVTVGRHLPRRAQSPQPAAPSDDPESEKQYAIRITDAVGAWELKRGDPSVVVAILDEGVDTQHEDLAGAVVKSFDAVDEDTFQEPNAWDGHGTACAGLAAAMHNNAKGIRGIGGGCSIQAVRIAYSTSPNANWTTTNSWIARAIDWSWQNGASVLSNSWGGGAPSTAIVNAFERARTQGRGGKGCVIVVAAGNESGPVSFPGNLPNVLTVSASNEFDEFKTKTSHDNETWWGSNFGPEVDVAAPGVHNWTTDISGASGYTAGQYTDFNGTSSATPIVAGACALLISANPNLTETEVRTIIRQSADKVGSLPYVQGRNDQFGNGRLNCKTAVQTALPSPAPQAAYTAVHRAIQSVAVKDNATARLAVAVGDNRPIRGVKVQVEIEHSWIGDLDVLLLPPANLGAQPVTLHSRAGRDADDIKRTFDTTTTPALSALVGRTLPGTWTLEVRDNQARDEGAILAFGLEFQF